MRDSYQSPYPYREGQKLHWLCPSGLASAKSVVVKKYLNVLLLDIWRAAETEV